MSTKREAIIGTAFAIVSALGYGSSAVLIKKGLTGATPPLVGAAVSLVSGTVGLGIIALTNPGSNLRQEKKSVGLLLIAGIFAGLGVLNNFLALNVAPVVVVSPLTSANPLFALLWSHLFLRRLEKITLRVVLGTILVVGGVVLITVGKAV